jgi:hypothetical protein
LKKFRVVPSLVEDRLPIVREAVGGGVAVELHGHCFDDQPDVDQEGFEGALGNLIGEGALVDGHLCLHFWVYIGGMASHHDQRKVAGDETHLLDFIHDLEMC